MTNAALMNQNQMERPPKNGKTRDARRSQSAADLEFRGRFLSIQPGDELVFENKGPERDSSDFIELTNCTDSFVAFKVKTTAPEKFRVKPSFGWIESGGSRTVEVSIQPGFLLTAQRDKFLVMSAGLEAPPRSHNELLDYWHELLRNDTTAETVDEHRLRCTIITHTSDKLDAGDGLLETTRFEPVIPPIVLEKLEAINSKMDRLMALHQLESDLPLHKKQCNVLSVGVAFLVSWLFFYLVQPLLGRV